MLMHCYVAVAAAECRDLPTAAPGQGNYWPSSCRNTLVGDFCVSKVCEALTRGLS